MKMLRKIIAFGILIVLIIIGYQTVMRSLSYGDWETLIDDELGYKMEYPASWSAETFPAGFENMHRGLRMGIRAFFYHDLFIPIDTKTVSLYWLPTTDPEVALEWGNNRIENDRKSTALQKVHVGSGKYPALTRIYQTNDGTRRVVYIVTHNGSFVLKFWAKNYTGELETIFDHMLASFEFLPVSSQ